MMERKLIFNAIGRYFGEDWLSDFMRELNVSGTPELGDGGEVSFISAEPQGIELAFKDEASLDERYLEGREYPEGAMILSNVRFYGHRDTSFSAYAGQLPDGLEFGMSRRQIEACLGPAQKEFMRGETLKWFHDDGVRCLVCIVRKDELVQVSVQYVLESEL